MTKNYELVSNILTEAMSKKDKEKAKRLGKSAAKGAIVGAELGALYHAAGAGGRFVKNLARKAGSITKTAVQKKEIQDAAKKAVKGKLIKRMAIPAAVLATYAAIRRAKKMKKEEEKAKAKAKKEAQKKKEQEKATA